MRIRQKEIRRARKRQEETIQARVKGLRKAQPAPAPPAPPAPKPRTRRKAAPPPEPAPDQSAA